MSDWKDSDLVVNSELLALCLGISIRKLQNLAKDDVIPIRRKNPYRYYLPDAIQAYFHHNTKTKELDPLKQTQIEKLEKEIDFRRVKTEQERLKLEEYKGNLHHSDDVEEAMEALVMTAKQGILSFRSKLQNRMAADLGIEIAVCGDEIRKAQDEVLNDLYKTRYDVNFFKKRSEERLKHEEEQEEESTNAHGSDE